MSKTQLSHPSRGASTSVQYPPRCTYTLDRYLLRRINTPYSYLHLDQIPSRGDLQLESLIGDLQLESHTGDQLVESNIGG